MLKLDIGFLSTSLAIFMNNQDPQTPRKMKKNGVKNLKRAYPYPKIYRCLRVFSYQLTWFLLKAHKLKKWGMS